MYRMSKSLSNISDKMTFLRQQSFDFKRSIILVSDQEIVNIKEILHIDNVEVIHLSSFSHYDQLNVLKRINSNKEMHIIILTTIDINTIIPDLYSRISYII